MSLSHSLNVYESGRHWFLHPAHVFSLLLLTLVTHAPSLLFLCSFSNLLNHDGSCCNEHDDDDDDDVLGWDPLQEGWKMFPTLRLGFKRTESLDASPT